MCQHPITHLINDILFEFQDFNQHLCPTLSQMAQDYLTIQGSATPSEHTFSSGGLTGTKCCNCLNGVVFESLQLLKSMYCNGHISTSSDAKQHIDALIASFDDKEVGDDLPKLIGAELYIQLMYPLN